MCGAMACVRVTALSSSTGDQIWLQPGLPVHAHFADYRRVATERLPNFDAQTDSAGTHWCTFERCWLGSDITRISAKLEVLRGKSWWVARPDGREGASQ